MCGYILRAVSIVAHWVAPSLAMVAVDAEEIALGHFIVENGLDILEFGAFGVVVDEAADAAIYTREGV